MVRLATEKDENFILDLMGRKGVKEFVTDDLTPEIKSLDISKSLIICCGDEGFFLFIPRNSITYEIHTAFVPECRGKKVNAYFEETANWLKKNTDCRKIIAEIPEYNYRAKAAAVKSGFVAHGVNTNSFLKNGKIINQYIYGKEI